MIRAKNRRYRNHDGRLQKINFKWVGKLWIKDTNGKMYLLDRYREPV